MFNKIIIVKAVGLVASLAAASPIFKIVNFSVQAPALLGGVAKDWRPKAFLVGVETALNMRSH